MKNNDKLAKLLNQKIMMSDLLGESQQLEKTCDNINSDNQIKVVHLCTQDFGGAGNAAYRLHKGLQAIGVDSIMLVLNKRSGDSSVKVLPNNYSKEMTNCLDVSAYNSPVWNQQAVRWQKLMLEYPRRPAGLEVFTDAVSDVRLDRVQEIQEADIINLHWVAGGMDWPNASLAIGGKPIVWTLHDMNSFTGGCHYAGDCKKYIEACMACPQLGSNVDDDLSHQVWTQKYDAYKSLNINIVTPSRWLGGCASDSELFSRFPVNVIPYGFPIDIFKPHPKAEIRKALNIPESAKVILFGAESVVNTRKGFIYLLEALNRHSLKSIQDSVILTFGSLPESVKITSRYPVYNLGRIADENQLALAYSTADVFVIPSLEDNLPNTVVEAMACGVPVVGFDIGGIPDMIDHKKTGFLVKPKDIAGLIEGVEWVISSSDSGKNISERCREKVEKEYALEVQAKSYYELYKGIFKDHFPLVENIYSKVRTLNQQGEDLFTKGDLEGALDVFTKALDIVPNNAVTHNNLGVLYYNLGDKEKALNHYRRAAELQPENITFQKNLADFYYVEMGQVEEAMQIYVKVLNANPEDIETLLILGHICVALKKFDDAKDFYSRILIIEPWNKDAKQFLEELEKCQLSVAGDRLGSEDIETASKEYFVSAIVSTYNSERFIRGCLEDLESQTIADELEIVIVNSGSEQNEDKIIKEFQEKYSNIKYIKTYQRETIYQAWNRGVKAATGKYITNANTDDRHRKDAFELLAKVLDENQDVALVYADQIITEKENETLEKYTQAGIFFWPDFDRNYLLKVCSTGSQPMWRKSVHEEFGYFDESMHIVGDYEFWLRITQKYFLKHVPELLGLYYRSSQNAEYRNHQRTMQETALVQSYYKTKLMLNEPQVQGNPLVSVIIPTYNRSQQLETALKSVALQSYENIEAIVINDGGEDVSVVIGKFKGELEIQYITHKQNKDRAAARNTGLKNARGEYIAYLDDDDIFHNDHIETALRVLTNSGFKIVYSDAFRTHQKNIDGNYQIIRKDIPYSTDYQPGIFLKTNITPTTCIIHEKSVIDEVGYFDESLPVLEDWDLWIRISQKYEFYHIKKVTCEFTWRDDGSTTTSAKIDQFAKYRQRITERYLKKSPLQKEKDQCPLVSIIILTFNALQYTKKCVRSIQQHTVYPYEIIFVDNASTDGTAKYLRKIVRKHDNFSLIENKENKGFAAGNNQGMAVARGDYILLMNNDVVVTPGWLDRMISCAEKSPDIGMVGPVSNYVSGPQLVDDVKYNTSSLAGLNEFAAKRAEKYSGRSRRILRVVGFCMLIKRAVVDKIGGLDSRYGLGNFEDDDFSLRAALAGFGSCIAEDCFIHHFGNRTFIGAKIDYRESLLKNWEIFKEKWGLPKELSYGSPYNVMQISKGGFVPEKHYYPLTGRDFQWKNEFGNTSFDSNSNAAEKIYINEIQPLINEGKHEKATIALEELITLYPKFALAYNDLGVLYFNKGEKEKALSYYEKAVQLQPENIIYQKNLADFYYVVLGRVEEAMQIYVKVLNTNPEDIETLLIIGHICISMEKFDNAKVFYSRVLKIEPRNEDAGKFLEKVEKYQILVADSQLNLETGNIEHLNRKEQKEENNKNIKMHKNAYSSDKVIQRHKAGLSQVPVVGIEEHKKLKLKSLNPDIQVSIIIPTSGQQKYIKNCVESIKKHTPQSHEIIFVENGATKGTEKWLKNNINGNLNYHAVKCLKDANYAGIYNEGIKASTGEYILLLSNDVVVTKGWLDGMLECLQSIPDTGVVGPMSNVSRGTQRVLTVDNISTDQIDKFAESFMNKNRNRRISSFSIDGFCMFFNRNLVEEIGLFDEQFGKNGYEDEDFSLRAVMEGHRNIIAGDVYVHQQGKKDFSRNKKYFNAKWNKADAQSLSGKKFLTLKAIEKGSDVYQRGHIDNAVEILLEGIGLSPDDKRSYYAFAEILLNAKNYKDVIDVLNEMPQDEQDLRSIELIGYCKEGMDLDKEALNHADRVLSIKDNSAQALNLKGILAFKQGDISFAEDYFNKSIESDPGYGEPYTNLGAILWDNQPEKALDLFEKGFILSPTITDIVTNYHSAVTASGEFDRAGQVFEEACSLYPNNKMIRYQLIDVLIKQEKNAEAMHQIEEAIALYGVDDGVLSAALKIRDMLGPIEIDETKDKKYTVSLCMIVKNEEQYLAKCLRSVKPVVDEMIVVDTGSTDRTKEIARAFGVKIYDFKWTDDFSEARNLSISKASGRWTFHLDADEVISSLDYEAFRKIIRQSATKQIAFLINTRNYTMDVNQVEWTANDGKYDKEEAATGWTPSKKVRLFRIESSIRFEYPIHEMVDPSLKRAGITVKECSIPVHHYGKLNKEKSSGKVEVYYQIGRKKLDEMGDDTVAIRELAIQAEIIKKHDEAIELWERFIAIEPSVPKAYINMGISYCSLGKFEEVLETAKKAMKLAPDLKEAHYNYALGKLHLGSAAEAVSILEKLLERLGEYPPAQFLLAAAYCCDGKKEKGINELKELQKSSIGPGLPIRCHELAKGLVSSHRNDYAIMLLEVAIDSKNSNKDVLELYSKCLEMMNIDRKTGTKRFA